MRSVVLISLLIILVPNIFSQSTNDKPIGVFNFSLEFELNNDQGELSTKDYLKQFGTKGKTRAHNEMFPVLQEFFMKEFKNRQIPVQDFDELADIKTNAYGLPSMTLRKAVNSNRFDRYLRITLKDIGQVPAGQMTGSGTAVVKIVKMRCRLQVYDGEKNLLKVSEGFFSTGEKVGSKYDVGVDLRQYSGSGRLQELKFYEVCCKMAFMQALEKF